jgi:hypothetical protein
MAGEVKGFTPFISVVEVEVVNGAVGCPVAEVCVGARNPSGSNSTGRAISRIVLVLRTFPS